MAWTIELDAKAKKQLGKIARADAIRIIAFLEERLLSTENPRQLGDALQGSKLGHLWRYRVGNYRILCDIQDERLVVLVIEIGHRREVYR